MGVLKRRSWPVAAVPLLVTACTSGIDLDTYAPECGDGLREGVEGCDDGNRIGGDGCSAVCTQEAGYICVVPSCDCDRTFDCDESCPCDSECGGSNPTDCTPSLACDEVEGANPPVSRVWQQRCIPLSVDTTGKVFSLEENRQALEDAIGAWTADCSDLQFVFAGETGHEFGLDWDNPDLQRNTVTSADNDRDVDTTGVRGLVGITATTYLIPTGEILDADIVLNAVQYNFGTSCGAKTTMHLPSVLTGLLGSALGFAEVDDPTSSVNRTINPCDTAMADISDADRARLCSVYPYRRSSNACHAPPGSYLDVEPSPLPFRDQCARLGFE